MTLNTCYALRFVEKLQCKIWRQHIQLNSKQQNMAQHVVSEAHLVPLQVASVGYTTPSSGTASQSQEKSIWSRLFGRSSTTSEPVSPQRELPSQYSDCIGYSEKINWVNSERGQLILSQRPVLQEYHKNGKLERMIKNKHWDIRLNEWLYVSHETTQPIPVGLAFDTPKALKPNAKQELAIHRDNPPVPVMFKDHPHFLEPMPFPTSSKYDILTDGYTVFRGIISEDVVHNAVAAISKMVVESEEFNTPLSERIKNPKRGLDPFFTSGSTNDEHVLALYYCSPIFALVESLLHNEIPAFDPTSGKGQFHPRAGGAQVAFRFSQAAPAGRRHAASRIGGKSWHLDGMDKGQYGPFSLLIGVALSDQMVDNCGNLAVHPGSHHVLKSFLKQYSAACDHSDLDKANEQAVQERRLFAVSIVQNKPILEEPVQVKLQKGDVVFALHKVAHLGTPNYSDNIRKMVYFRVSHRDLHNIRKPALDDLWIEYEGMSEVLY